MQCWDNSTSLKNHIFSCLNQLGLKPSKFRGQNFLIDANIINYQINKAEINSNDVILEIGGGTGNITRCLAINAKKVYTIEQDYKFSNFLQEYFSTYKNVEIITGDAIKVEWPKFTKCISNLPYQISSPVTFKLFNHEFEQAILMYQKEFAERMLALPNTKNYSRLSVMVNLYAKCEKLKNVRASSFYPAPKVESTIMKLKPIKTKLRADKEKEEYSVLITTLFCHKNKNLGSVLSSLFKRKEKIGLGKYDGVIEKLPNVNRRIFSLSINELLEVYYYLKKEVGEKEWFNIISLNMD